MAYTIEEEQELNELKNWWKENYKSLIATILVTFAAVFGWNYWQSYQTNKIQQTSALYAQAIYAEQDKTTQVEQFVKEHSKTAYAVLALLDSAKQAVENQQFAQAESLLQKALKQSEDEILSAVSALRLAAVQFQQQNFEAALNTLEQVKGASWEGKKYLLTGDIFLAEGDKDNAKANYEKALPLVADLEKQWLQVRLNNL
ncbi:tetratricopeptide repeat protein [[Haemophilus] felis]|nr:tetratricopeptide repeat protein [[Haemophilus] felis]